MSYFQQLLIVCTLVFFAGFVDSIAGGGGILSLPAYVVAGLPPRMALGSNKFSSVFGTSISSARFIKGKKVNIAAAVASIPAALGGAALGARLTHYVDEDILRYILIVSLPFLALFIIKSKRIGSETQTKSLPLARMMILSGLAGFVIGFYDGFFGPGAGTFLIIVFNTVIGLDILTSSGNAKLVNLASNLASVVTFASTGYIMYSIAAPAAICSILGNFIGSKLAIENGSKVIRPMFVVVLILLIGKIALDLFS